jgi:hypothetical protein
MALVFPSNPTQGQTHEGFEFDSTIGAWKLISSGSGGAGLSNWTEDSEGNLIPDTDNTIDLGSAEFNIRDMYVSNNSLWMGDRHKFGVTSAGKIKISKVRSDKVPKLVENAGGTQAGALTHAGVGQLHEMRLRHWIAYRRTLAGATGKETPEDVFDTDDAAEVEEVIELDETSMALKSAGAAAAGVTYSVNSLSDTTITALVNGQVLGVVGGEWVNTAVPLPPPSVFTVSPTTFGGDTGTEFTCVTANAISGSTIEFKTSAGVSYTAATTTVTSATSVKATTPRDFTVGEGPLSIVLTLPGGSSATLANAIQTGGSPVWTTAAGLIGAETSIGASFSSTVAASDPDGQALTYSVLSGSLAPGLSLNSTSGAITGTFNGTITAPTTYTFTIKAEDTAGNSADRQFSTNMVATPPALYVFDYIYMRQVSSTGQATTDPAHGRTQNIQHLITSSGWQDDSGNTGISPNNGWNSSYLLNRNASGSMGYYVEWTVPEDATYRMFARGAKGGDNAGSTTGAGNGASMQADFALTEGTKLYIIVGRQGQWGASGSYGGGGGGGTFVATWDGSTYQPLLVAGGGGGTTGPNWGGSNQNTLAGGKSTYETNITVTGQSGGSSIYNSGQAAGFDQNSNNANFAGYGNYYRPMAFINGSNGGQQGYGQIRAGGWGGGGSHGVHGGGGGGGFHGGDEGAHDGRAGTDGVAMYPGAGGSGFIRSGATNIAVAPGANMGPTQEVGILKITKL